LIAGATLVGIASVAIALLAAYFTDETFGTSRDFVER
jgi:hypothetical protein